MSDPPDPLLGALGAPERDEDRTHPAAWDDVLLGRRSAASAAETPGDPEEHAALAALFTGPVARSEVDALVARVLADAPPARPTNDPRPPVDPPARPPVTTAPVVPLRRRAVAVAGLALAAAAALLLWIRVPAPADGASDDYTLTLRTPGVQPDRNAAVSAAIPGYRGDSTIDWYLSPRDAVVDEVALRVLARDPTDQARLLAPAVQRSREGVLRVSGRLDTLLPLPPGRWSLRFLVTSPAAAPQDDAAAAALPATAELEIDVLPMP